MESIANSDAFGSSYRALPKIPDTLVDRNFRLSDGNVEITSMDIAPHGAFVVAGTSSGMVLLFDMSNPYNQKDGLLIGQIRARGMHTNLILTVKFSEDGRFVFAGVSKGSSEMLAIDLGKVLVEWPSSHQNESFSDSNKANSETLQQLQLQSMVTFSFSDAKLRGFGAVVRMDLPHSSENRNRGGNSSSSFADSSALYRLACGRGIKNVHIWHFTVGYLVSDASSEQQQQQLGNGGQRMMHGKWEYVCDVASNGNTITHIEFRRSGHELLSKSAGMGIRLWDLSGGDSANNSASSAAAACSALATTTGSSALPIADATQGDDGGRVSPAVSAAVPPVGPVPGPTWLIKPSYTDISNSQDVKCLLPVGSGAYGGTYQFAVLNTSAPKEANRDVLELPERFSGDAAAPASSNLLRGRRITREIEQVICTDEGAHALLLCADGGVVYYQAPTEHTNGTAAGESKKKKEDGEEEEGSAGTDCGSSSGSMRGSGAGSLVELPHLFRQKDLQQHTGSWALRRVGLQGLVVLLRAYPEAGTSGAVVVEARLLAEHLPADASQQLLCEGSALGRIGVRESAQQHQLLYYQDSTSHSAQELARKAWKTLPAAAAAAAAVKRGITGAGGNNSSQKAAKKVKLPHGSSADAVAGAAGEGEEAMDATTTVPLPRKKSGANLASGEKSPRPSASSHHPPTSADKRQLLVTPAAAPLNATKLNKVSPYDAADRLISCERDGSSRGGSASPLAGLPPAVFPRSSRLTSRQLQQQNGANSLSSFAKLRALRDDDSSGGEEDHTESAVQTLPTKVHSYKELEVGPAPKVRRLSIPELPASWTARTPTTTTSDAVATIPVATPTCCVTQKEYDEVLIATAKSVFERWTTLCNSDPQLQQLSALSYSRKEEGGAVLGLAGRPSQQALGSTALQRLGVIIMEQDRLKAQFLREVTAQVTPLIVPSPSFATPAGSEAALKGLLDLVSLYRSTSQELVQRQQLELQCACAIDSICSASCAYINPYTSSGSSKTPTAVTDNSSCWGEGLKVVYRHDSLFVRAQALHHSLTEVLLLASRGSVGEASDHLV